jgi:hypothetical protein
MIHLGPGLDDHVFGKLQAAQCPLRILSAAQRIVGAFRNDDDEIKIAVLRRLTPRMGAEEPDLLWRKLRHQSPCGPCDDRLGLLRCEAALAVLSAGLTMWRI